MSLAPDGIAFPLAAPEGVSDADSNSLESLLVDVDVFFADLRPCFDFELSPPDSDVLSELLPEADSLEASLVKMDEERNF